MICSSSRSQAASHILNSAGSLVPLLAAFFLPASHKSSGIRMSRPGVSGMA